MTTIVPDLKYVNSFKVTGLSVRTKNRDEFNKETAKLPLLWQQFYSSELVTDNPTILGVYSKYESDTNGFYTVTAGIACENERTEFDLVKVQAGNYLVFQNAGPMPLAVIEAWQQVWAYFAAESQYQRNFVTDFEAYSGADEVTIYIGIK